MLNDMESAIAFIEKQDTEVISRIKNAWSRAFEKASRILLSPEKLRIEYNPAIWRISRHPVGIRMVSSPWGMYFIFEFASPNLVLPFDCFPSEEAKTGVMLHEIAHLIDDRRWGFDLRKLIADSSNYVTREQRAELLSFASYPLGIFEANRALIISTLKKLGYSQDIPGDYLAPLAAVETLGRIGMNRSDDLIRFYGEVETHFPVHRVLEEYISTYVFSPAGLVTVPDLNTCNDFGIKKSGDLALARAWLCKYLRGEIEISELEEKMDKISYSVKHKSYNPVSSMDFVHLDLKLAEEYRKEALRAFADYSHWKSFADLQNAIEKIDAWSKFISNEG